MPADYKVPENPFKVLIDGSVAMTAATETRDKELRPVRWWLIGVAALIVAMVLVGGADQPPPHRA